MKYEYMLKYSQVSTCVDNTYKFKVNWFEKITKFVV
jgi:hypothetical protein